MASLNTIRDFKDLFDYLGFPDIEVLTMDIGVVIILIKGGWFTKIRALWKRKYIKRYIEDRKSITLVVRVAINI